jgi:hypothetical protein
MFGRFGRSPVGHMSWSQVGYLRSTTKWVPLSCAFAACATSPSTGTLTLDGRPYATLQPQGWVHASGELALPIRGTDVAVSGGYLAANDYVECRSGRCSSERLAADVYIDGDQVFMGGVPRGSLADSDAFGRQSAVLLLELYDPPGSVFASREFGSDHERVSMGVLRDGRIVEGERCSWRDTCASLPTLGTWTEEQVTVNGTPYRLSDLVETGEQIQVRPTPESRPLLRFSSSETPDPWTGVYSWWIHESLRLDFERTKDASLDSPMAQAAFAALAIALNERHKAIPPPPPPPPAEDSQ